MTLRVGTLRSELLSIFQVSPDSPSSSADAERQWAAAYDKYASAATDASGDRVIRKNRSGFHSQLRFRAKTGTAATMAQNCDRAFVAYWTGAVFAVGKVPSPSAPCPSVGGNTIFGTEISSAVAAVAPGVLRSLLFPIFSQSVPGNTPSERAGAIANAFHKATTSAVTVLITGLDTTPPGSGGPLPITNTCTIF